MSQRRRRVKLSEHWQDGCFKCFKKTIGGRRFYLSNDRSESERMMMALEVAWGRICACGGCWTEEAIDDALYVAGFRRPTTRTKMGGKLYAAIDIYLDDYEGRVSESRYRRQVIALDAYKQFQSDCSLAAIDWNALNAAVNHFRSRPQTSAGETMAVATVQTNIKAIHAMYDWLDLSGRWEAPRRFDRIFRVSYQSLKTPAELKREGDGHDVFMLDELTRLWRNATPRQRTWMGLALGTGETAQGLASLLKMDIKRNGDNVVIDRNRNKTGVRGIYPLWTEVAALVISEMDKDETEPLAFKSLDGKPLVWFHETGRVDSVAKTWANLRTKTKDVRPLGFATLRKTGASIVEQLTGSLDVAQIYLSHKGRTIAEKHYLAKHFDKLAEALIKMRKYLHPLFDGEPPEDPSPEQIPSAAT